MSEQETEEKGSSDKIYPTPVKRFILTVIGLFIFVILFGEIVPRIMFKKEDKPATNTEANIKAPQEVIESKKETVTSVTNQETTSTSTQSPDESGTVASEPDAGNSVATPPPPAITSEPSVTQSSGKDKEYLRELEEKITALEATHKAEISEMQKKLETQNIESQHKSDYVISSLIIFGQLKDAVSNGRPYASELEQLKKFTADNPEISKIISLIEPDANTGVIVPEKLKATFSPLIKQALANKYESAGLKILHKFITVRKVGEQSGSTDEAILARAEIKLRQDDLNATLSELEQSSPEAKEIFIDWREGAQKLIDTQKNLSNLQLLITQTNSAAQP